jgi:hypothetical protein
MFTQITDERLESFRRNTNRPDLKMESASLPFYGRGGLVRITDKGDTSFWVVTSFNLDDAAWTALDGSSDNIYAANEACGLNLTEANVLDYLRFFCDFLDMDDDRLRIAGTGHVVIGGRKIVPTIAPALSGLNDGKFMCAAHALYSGAVFEATFSIATDGRVVMLSDNEIEPMTVH